ncbi:MAG: DUF4405 domain-containing protein [Ruminococcus sp.]|nr:DUF4405 domain-containing protein [Ruminococcus sp.]MCM1382085.1 DUF4405 domain-containing protein [Muribaculaceae bacterium]
MKPKMIAKLAVDILMTAALLLLMAYELVGQTAHEWFGVTMFALFAVHHILNIRWWGGLFKGKYSPLRVLQTVLAMIILICMLGSMFSGVVISRHIFTFISARGLRSFGRTLHMLSAYWGFVFMSLHLGFHWNMMINAAGKIFKKTSKIRILALRAIAVLTAGYGVYAFIKRNVGSYMFLKIQFAFFDFEEPVILFILDYLAVMALFVFIGHYLAKFLKYISKKSV